MLIDSISNNTYIKIGDKKENSKASNELSLITLYNDPNLHKTQESAKAIEIKGEDISSDSNWYVFVPQKDIVALKSYFQNDPIFKKSPTKEHTQEALAALDKMSLYWESQKDSKGEKKNFNEDLPRYRDYADYSNEIDKERYNIIRKCPDGLYEIKLGDFHILSTGAFCGYKNGATNTDFKDVFVNISQKFQNIIPNALVASKEAQSDSIMQILFNHSKNQM